MNARWQARVAELIETYPRLLGVSVHNKLRAEGFAGGYSTVTCELRELRGPRFKAAAKVSVPIHTDPGEEAQFDFCDLSDWAARWGWGRLWCFGMILCWRRPSPAESATGVAVRSVFGVGCVVGVVVSC